MRTSLKSYLLSCIANRIRSLQSQKNSQYKQDGAIENIDSDGKEPVKLAMITEQSKQIEKALSQLPYQQREVIILHLHSRLRFREIAQLQDESINTIQSRYRYGLKKLKSQLDGKV